MFKKCLKKSIKYKRKNNDILCITSKAGIVSTIVRKSEVIPEYVSEDFDSVFLNMLNYTSTIQHDLFVFPNEPNFDIITTEMGRWDCIPGFLIYNDYNGDQIDLHMGGCTCSSIINKLAATFTVPVLKTPFDLKEKYNDHDCTVAYLLPQPEILGYYSEKKTKIALLMRPTSFKIILL